MMRLFFGLEQAGFGCRRSNFAEPEESRRKAMGIGAADVFMSIVAMGKTVPKATIRSSQHLSIEDVLIPYVRANA